MMELNFNLITGFLIWSAFCLGMLLAERISSRKWKRAAKAMEAHAAHLQAIFDRTPPERLELYRRGFERSIPEGVITHAKKR